MTIHYPGKIKDICKELMQQLPKRRTDRNYFYFFSKKFNIGCKAFSIRAMPYLIYYKGRKRTAGFYLEMLIFLMRLPFSTLSFWKLPHKRSVIVRKKKCLLVHNFHNATLFKILNDNNATIQERIRRVVIEDSGKNTILHKPHHCGTLLNNTHFFYGTTFFADENPVKKEEWPGLFYRDIFPELLSNYEETGIEKKYVTSFLANYWKRFQKKGYEKELEKIFEILLKLSQHPDCRYYYSAITHGDLHRWNVLRSRNGIKLIDWDYSTRRNAFFDLFVIERSNPNPKYWENLFHPDKYELTAGGRASFLLSSFLTFRKDQDRSVVIAFHMVAAFAEAISIEKLKKEDQSFHTLYDAILSLSVPQVKNINTNLF